jgi:hypothetical protein
MNSKLTAPQLFHNSTAILPCTVHGDLPHFDGHERKNGKSNISKLANSGRASQLGVIQFGEAPSHDLPELTLLCQKLKAA